MPTTPHDDATQPAMVLQRGAALGSEAAVELMLASVFADVGLRGRARAALSECNVPPADMKAEELLRALVTWLQQQQAGSDGETRRMLAALTAHVAQTRRAENAYSESDRANPNAVWWPVPNHPKRPRKAAQELPWAKRTPLLSPQTAVGSAGSCFASEVAHRLQTDGFNYVVTQPNLNANKGTHNSCCRWGALFNLASFRQLVERAYGEWNPRFLLEREAVAGVTQFGDPWLTAINYVSEEEARTEHSALAEAARAALDQVEVFIFTMGLSEVWRLKATGEVLARMPVSIPRHFVEPVLLSYEDNIAELERLWALWRRHNPRVKLILSVSPIPLNATVQGDDQHVIAATCEAKSILRAVAGAFSRRHADVHYFPSYDLVSYCITHPWTDDGRHVTRQTVDRVMTLFDHMFVTDAVARPLQLPPDAVVIDQRAGLELPEVRSTLQALVERGLRNPVAVMVSQRADRQAAQRALASLLHRGGMVAVTEPGSVANWRQSLRSARLLVTRRLDAPVLAVRDEDHVPTCSPDPAALASRLGELSVERQVRESLAPLLHGAAAQLVAGLIADRKRTLAMGRGTERGAIIHRRLFVASRGSVSDAMHQAVQRNLPFCGPVPARGVLGELTAERLAEATETLHRDGALVWPERLDPELVSRLKAFARAAPCRPRLELDKHGPEMTYPGAEAASVRYDFPESVVAKSADAVALALDESLRAVAGAYLGCDAVLDFLHLWWSTSANPEGAEKRQRMAVHAAQMYHWDLPRAAFIKVFVYLTDVTPDTGPHCYIRGSHRNKPAPVFRDGRISDDEIAQHYPAEDRLELTGPAGTIVIADTRGFHKGKTLASGERLLFQVEFSVEHFGTPYDRILLPDDAPQALVDRVRASPRAYRHVEVPSLS